MERDDFDDDENFDIETFDDDEYFDGDDDDATDYTPAEARTRVDDRMRRLRRLARTSSRDGRAVAEARAILDELESGRRFRTEDGASLPPPPADAYNRVLEAYAYSKDPDGARRAEELLDRMNDPDDPHVARPNVESYLNVMDAHAMRGDPDAVSRLFQQQQQRKEHSSDDDDDDALTVTVEAYNKLIKAYGIAGDIGEAERTFRTLLDNRTANHKSYVQLMKAYMGRGDAAAVESLFREMTGRYESTGECRPQTEAYNVLIRATAATRGPAQAEARLYELMDRFRKGDGSCRPDADTFRNVVSAYNQDRKQQHSAATVAKLDQLLQIKHSFLSLHGDDDDDESSTADERLYSTVVGIVARSKDPQKATRAKRIIDRFRKTSSAPATPVALRSMYQSLLGACAYPTKDATAQDKLNAFAIALQAYNELRNDTSTIELDSSMAGVFLMACRTLLPEGSKRDEVVQKVFDDCCHRGIVDDYILNELDGLTTGATQLQWLGGFIEDGVRVKQEWRRNVNKRR